jgi:hypothetical protein
MEKTYAIKAKVWQHSGMGGWYFVTIPTQEAQDIDDHFGFAKRGWGSLPVEVKLGKTIWRTSIFPDKKTNSYVLPLKAEVRKKEGIGEGDSVTFSLKIRD